ncbi:L,D-transpeptidase family protein [Algoriphagus formosus]|uniref:Murein L,D-transpeptidase n=1 Tax=Algoriphagus formosus TaxID=2007308 RepID=A0A4R5US81_9BACT|nr:L,D-transpeptidase family protein [Algoriphagus aquimaris]TDK41835.1 murein L,D-transpeptidase [Algoriphagus aquimaris]
MRFSLLCYFFLFGFISFGQETDLLRQRLENTDASVGLEVRGRTIQNFGELFKFYSSRDFQFIWSKEARIGELAYEGRYELEQAQFDGLQPSDYHWDLINTLIENYESNKKIGEKSDWTDLVDLELLLSDGLIQLAKHLHVGKVDPSELQWGWEIIQTKESFDPIAFLNQIDQSQRVRSNIFQYYPEFRIYLRGREILRNLSELSKVDSLDWSALSVNKSIKVGDSHSLIPEIRERLQFWGYVVGNDLTERIYDSLLMKSVQAYQSFHGMTSDGIIGKSTLASLSQSPKDMMDKVAVNLERLRWLDGKKNGSKAILVNIADYKLVLLEKEDTIFQSKVIVGKSYHQSPVFEAKMSYLVFSPYWNIPESIVRNEIIPSVRKNPNYLTQKNMEVLTYNREVVDPSTIDWKKRSIPYLVRQKPGPQNSLGLVKFMFPNKHSVYIHDTPAKSLFGREERALSHGCIRLEKPRELAQLLLQDQKEWDDQKIWDAMNSHEEQTVNLKEKIPVYLIYLTFWADATGKPNYRPDIYGRDGEVLTLLRN